MHEKEYCQFMNQEEVALKNQSICKFIESDSQDDADVQIANLMIRQNCSFLFIESPELKKLFKLAYPKLELRGHQHFRKNVIPKMALNIRKKITQRVGNDYYAITSDGWIVADLSIPELQDNEFEDDESRGSESISYNIWSPGPKSPSVPLAISGEIESDLTSKIEVELAQYKAEKRIDIDGDIFLWLGLFIQTIFAIDCLGKWFRKY
uniref:Uncharacterized protein n=1 Tax=Meloidogyne incognita TaxID=6306 RepID=A0A914LQP9_MELIC